jgi:hypothetical protein
MLADFRECCCVSATNLAAAFPYQRLVRGNPCRSRSTQPDPVAAGSSPRPNTTPTRRWYPAQVKKALTLILSQCDSIDPIVTGGSWRSVLITPVASATMRTALVDEKRFQKRVESASLVWS